MSKEVACAAAIVKEPARLRRCAQKGASLTLASLRLN